VLADPTGYGRIVRDGRRPVLAIVEHKDATPAQREIREVYTGMMAAPTARSSAGCGAANDNAQKEYYLTDIVAMAVAEGVPVVATQAADETEVLGVNSPLQLADLERRFQRRQADAADGSRRAPGRPGALRPARHAAVRPDVDIDVGCVFEGEVTLGDDVRIGAHCVIRNARIAPAR
jgi:bifunctional UDP-N-acetylglucosamine pyrophosphorylase/glucosamine-1-phosphate N-acetyltransferase